MLVPVSFVNGAEPNRARRVSEGRGFTLAYASGSDRRNTVEVLMSPRQMCVLPVLALLLLPLCPAAGPGGAKEEKKAAVDLYDDPLPPGALARFGTVRFRLGTSAVFLSFVQDGKSVLSVSRDQTVRLWETASGKELRHFKGGGSFFQG